jgi:hypothetical protein
MLVACTDQVAIDAYAGETFFNLTPDDMKWVTLAESRGLGTADYRSMPFEEITV